MSYTAREVDALVRLAEAQRVKIAKLERERDRYRCQRDKARAELRELVTENV